jgi:hypothetical protein
MIPRCHSAIVQTSHRISIFRKIEGGTHIEVAIWLNRKLTLEVNTPSHEQCVVAHLERNESRNLMQTLRRYGEFLPDKEEIKKISYLDPYDMRNEWNNQ